MSLAVFTFRIYEKVFTALSVGVRISLIYFRFSKFLIVVVSPFNCASISTFRSLEAKLSPGFVADFHEPLTIFSKLGSVDEMISLKSLTLSQSRIWS